jgi:hypothetical protein
MLEGMLFGIVVLLILAALIGILNWLFDHGRAVTSALIVLPILLWIWWQEWFGNVFVFALVAILLLGIVAWVHEGLVRLRSHRASDTRDHRDGS